MGCGASLCTVEQQNEIFEIAAKEMLRLCVERACSSMESIDKIKIPLPPQVNRVRDLAESMRLVSATAKSHMKCGVGGVGAKDSISQSMSEGFLSGFQMGNEEKSFLGKAAEFVDTTAEFIGSGVGVVAEKALLAAAAGIDQAVRDLEGPLSFAARAWLWQSKDDVLNSIKNEIDKIKLEKPVNLVRGEAPHGPAQFKACPTNALSYQGLYLGSATNLEELFLPLAADTIAKHKVDEVWDSLIWKYDQARRKLKEYVSSESFQNAHSEETNAKLLASLEENKISFDVHRYIVGQTLQELVRLMGEQEGILRLAPSGKSSKPETFNLCFSQDLDGHLTLGRRLPLECYKRRNT